jgi:uridine phosphorylase
MPEAAKYVSCKSGALVTRYGTRSYIGAVLDMRTGESTFNEAEVVKLPLSEWNAYLKEYTRCVKAGVLIERDEKAYEGWLKAQAKASEAEAAAIATAAEGEKTKAKEQSK